MEMCQQRQMHVQMRLTQMNERVCVCVYVIAEICVYMCTCVRAHSKIQ